MTKFKKLTRREFSRAIKLGHGRAMLHLKEYGDKFIDADIKRSLVCSQAYDVQFEGLRSWWLWQLVTLTGRPNYYADHLLRNFNLPSQHHYDVAQQFELAKLFFELGRDDFAPAMVAGFQRMAHKPAMSACGRSLIEVAGLEGLDFVARTCGESPDLVDDYECSQVLKLAIETFDEPTVVERMKTLGKKERSVKRFMDVCKKFKAACRSRIKRPTATQPTFEELLATLQNREDAKVSVPGKFRSFGRRATALELERVADLLNHATDEVHRLAFLSVFQFVQLPKISNEVIDLLGNKNYRVRFAAAKALSHSKSPDVRSLALSLLQSGQSSRIQIAFELLKNNYVPSDSDLINAALVHLKGAFDIHSVGMAVRNLCKLSDGVELEAAVLWFYENGPDTYCRLPFLELLVEWRRCPPEILYEAQWDAGSEVRAFARSLVAQEKAPDS